MSDSQKMQAKSTTKVDNYVCKLLPETRKIAELELRETDETRKHALRELREWAVKNPRIISIRLDAVFLLKFLRCKKFSLPMAKEMIERYIVLRHVEHEGVKIFQNLDPQLPVIQELFQAGYIFALPKRDAKGRRVIMVRPGVFNSHKYRNYDMILIHGIVYETLMEDEENQVNGFVHIIDSSNMSLAHLTLFTPKEAYKIGKNLEKLLPMRHKQIHGLKVLPSIKFAVDFALSKMTPKMKQRVSLHQKVEDVTIDKSLLPKEYGGKVPMKEMIDAFLKEVEAKREILLNNDNMSVHLHLYPQDIREGSVRSLNKSIEKMSMESEKIDFLGVQGSFRKLEID